MVKSYPFVDAEGHGCLQLPLGCFRPEVRTMLVGDGTSSGVGMDFTGIQRKHKPHCCHCHLCTHHPCGDAFRGAHACCRHCAHHAIIGQWSRIALTHRIETAESVCWRCFVSVSKTVAVAGGFIQQFLCCWLRLKLCGMRH